MRRAHVLPYAFVVLAAVPLSAQVTPPRSDVPVTTVVLYSSGVGYFEHAGTVRGSGTTELRFKTAQMNDVLKSLVLQDQDGGRISTITYPSQDPISKTLRSFQVDITANPGMAQLLNQLRGARVTVQSQAERISGTVLGVETRTRADDKDQAINVATLNLLTGATIRSIELPAISALSLDDPQLQEELTRALTQLSQARDQDKKPVTINFSGTGDHRVRIGYVVEAPIWKTSYRLLLGEKDASLQGWAIVENQTESDWNNVSLSLVSGRPISFTMDLYSPLYMDRPSVELERYASLRPRTYEGGIAADAVGSLRGAVPGAGGRGGAASTRRIGYDANGNPLVNRLSEVVATSSSPMDAASSVISTTNGARLGELFQYTVGSVSLPRQKSAMIPIVTDTVSAERVSIYNAGVLGSNPLNGVRLTNTTGKDLLQGPITVVEKGRYAGDATIDNLPAGQQRLLSYGIDLDVTVNAPRTAQPARITSGRISKGVLYLERKTVATQNYVADNKSDRAKTLIVEHPANTGWRFAADSPKPFETTPSVARFTVALAAKQAATLSIREELVTGEGIALVAGDMPAMMMLMRTNEIPSAVRDAIGRAVELRQAVLDVEREIGARTQRIAEIGVEQARIRENMKTVGQTSEYYQRLLGKLNEQESSIEKLQRERDDLSVKRDAARKELEEYLAKLEVV